jgi:hypothetical protein
VTTSGTEKLVKVLALLGSSHDGERAAAAAAADRMLREAGLTWDDVIRLGDTSAGATHTPHAWPSTVRASIAFIAAREDALTAWERNFVRSIRNRRLLSRRQCSTVGRIRARLKREADHD